jgi:hypothetical protein
MAPLATYNQTKLGMGILMLQAMLRLLAGTKASLWLPLPPRFYALDDHTGRQFQPSAAKHAGPCTVGCFCHRMIAAARNLPAVQGTMSRFGEPAMFGSGCTPPTGDGIASAGNSREQKTD